jgi:hypothetical protein
MKNIVPDLATPYVGTWAIMEGVTEGMKNASFPQQIMSKDTRK